MQINPLAFANTGVQKVIEVLERHQPDSVRLVGGCVRDAIMNRPVADIDFATPVHPLVVTEIFTKAGFNVEPTGIEHGTVTVIWDHEPFEITTLRRDVETDGRRAVVEFAETWEEDAFRRDFTFNALYLAPDGTVHDYNGGIEDALNGRIRFMGDAEQRIREDFLRILRMFRFAAVLGARIDDEALAATALLKDGIATLSGERLEKEVIKLLNGKDRNVALLKMAETGVFEKVFGFVPDIGAVLARLNRQRNTDVRLPPLAVVMAWDAVATDALMDRWKSGNDLRKLVGDVVRAGPVDQFMTTREARVLAFRTNVFQAVARLELAWVVDPEVQVEALVPLRNAARSAPAFPLFGRDVLDMGVKPGRVVGEILRAVTERWVAADFPADAEVRAMLKEEVDRVAVA